MIRLRALLLALAASTPLAPPAQAQWFGVGPGYGGYGIGGFGYGLGIGGFGYGGFGYGGYGLGGLGYGGFGYGGYGMGFLPPYGFGYQGLTYGVQGYYPAGPFAAAYGYGTAIPGFNLGLTPLATQTLLEERILRSDPVVVTTENPIARGIPSQIQGYQIIIQPLPAPAAQPADPTPVPPGPVEPRDRPDGREGDRDPS